MTVHKIESHDAHYIERLWVCTQCFAASREPGQCGHHSARAMGAHVETWPKRESVEYVPAERLRGAVDALLDRLDREGLLREGLTATDVRNMWTEVGHGQPRPQRGDCSS